MSQTQNRRRQSKRDLVGKTKSFMRESGETGEYNEGIEKEPRFVCT